MKKAQKRDAVRQELFYFKKQVAPEDDEFSPTGSLSHDEEYTLMSIDAIINGKV